MAIKILSTYRKPVAETHIASNLKMELQCKEKFSKQEERGKFQKLCELDVCKFQELCELDVCKLQKICELHVYKFQILCELDMFI